MGRKDLIKACYQELFFGPLDQSSSLKLEKTGKVIIFGSSKRGANIDDW